MTFDPENRVVKLCAQGMDLEGESPNLAAKKFNDAWKLASTPLEKSIAAHYVARHQPSKSEKLHWDEMALAYAIKAEKETLFFLPSLLLNIARGYEDLGRTAEALIGYKQAKKCLEAIPNDGYKKFVALGINKGLERLST